MKGKENKILCVLLLISLMVIVALSYCIIKVKDNKDQNPNDIIGEEKLNPVSDEDLITMKKVTEAIFYIDEGTRDNLKFEDIEKYKRVTIAQSLATGFLSYGSFAPSLSGSQLKETFKKYFNSDLELVPIPCFNTEHPNLYVYNSIKDKYEDNKEHEKFGHGGIMPFDVKVKYVDSGSKDNTYTLTAYVYYQEPMVQDCNLVILNKLAEANQIDADIVFSFKGDLTPGICVKNSNGIYECDEDLAFEIVKDKLHKYTMEFEKIDGRLVFKSYSKVS